MLKNVNPGFPFRSSAKVTILALLTLATTLGTLAAAEVPVRFVVGALHGFLVLRTLEGTELAQGDLLQVSQDGELRSRMSFRFDDGSTMDETVVFTQRRVFTMKSYHLVQRGPVFPEDTDFLLERTTGKYRVAITPRKDGRAKAIEGTLDLPADVYNGMIPTIAQNLAQGAGETVHLVALTPQPRIIQLEITPANNQTILVGKLKKTAVHYVLRPKLGPWLKLFATVLGRVPPDEHAWILFDEVPAFVKVEGPFYMKGPVWRIELTSPRWPE